MKLVKREMLTLTPDLAAHYLNFNDYETQRPIREAHVEELVDKMEKGLFRFGEVAFGSTNGSKEKMMNGQHICTAVTEYNKPIECVVEHYVCNGPMEMSELFRQFEVLSRSLKDYVRHEAAALKLDWPLWVSQLIVSAASIDFLNMPRRSGHGGSVTSGVPYKSKKFMSKDKKVKLLENYLYEGEFIADILTVGGEFAGRTSSRRTAHMKRAPVVVVMMETWRVNIESAKDFWINVRDGEGLIREMAEYKYREFLQTCNTRTTQRISGMTSNHEYIYRGHIAWNAYRRGAATNLAYRSNADPPALV